MKFQHMLKNKVTYDNNYIWALFKLRTLMKGDKTKLRGLKVTGNALIIEY